MGFYWADVHISSFFDIQELSLSPSWNIVLGLKHWLFCSLQHGGNCYRLLLWLGEVCRGQMCSPDQNTVCCSASGGVKSWLERKYKRIYIYIYKKSDWTAMWLKKLACLIILNSFRLLFSFGLFSSGGSQLLANARRKRHELFENSSQQPGASAKEMLRNNCSLWKLKGS